MSNRTTFEEIVNTLIASGWGVASANAAVRNHMFFDSFRSGNDKVWSKSPKNPDLSLASEIAPVVIEEIFKAGQPTKNASTGTLVR